MDAADVIGHRSSRAGSALSGIVVASDSGKMWMEKGGVMYILVLYSIYSLQSLYTSVFGFHYRLYTPVSQHASACKESHGCLAPCGLWLTLRCEATIGRL